MVEIGLVSACTCQMGRHDAAVIAARNAVDGRNPLPTVLFAVIALRNDSKEAIHQEDELRSNPEYFQV